MAARVETNGPRMGGERMRRRAQWRSERRRAKQRDRLGRTHYTPVLLTHEFICHKLLNKTIQSLSLCCSSGRILG